MNTSVILLRRNGKRELPSEVLQLVPGCSGSLDSQGVTRGNLCWDLLERSPKKPSEGLELGLAAEAAVGSGWKIWVMLWKSWAPCWWLGKHRGGVGRVGSSCSTATGSQKETVPPNPCGNSLCSARITFPLLLQGGWGEGALRGQCLGEGLGTRTQGRDKGGRSLNCWRTGLDGRMGRNSSL